MTWGLISLISFIQKFLEQWLKRPAEVKESLNECLATFEIINNEYEYVVLAIVAGKDCNTYEYCNLSIISETPMPNGIVNYEAYRQVSLIHYIHKPSFRK